MALRSSGEPYSNLCGTRLWMVYLQHRWGIDSGVRYIGGMHQNIVVKGETLPATEICAGCESARDTRAAGGRCRSRESGDSGETAGEPGGSGRRNRFTPIGPDIDNMAMSTDYAFD